MAISARNIPVSVEFKANAESMKRIVDNLTEQFSHIDPGTALGKSFTKNLPALKKFLNLYQSITNQQLISEQDLNDLDKANKGFNRTAQILSNNLATGSFSSFLYDKGELTTLDEINAKLEEAIAKKKTLAEATNKTILNEAVKGLQPEEKEKANTIIQEAQKIPELKQISGNKTVGENSAAINTAMTNTQQQINNLNKELKELGKVDASGFLIKDVAAIDKRKGQIIRSKDYKAALDEEVFARQDYQEALAEEKEQLVKRNELNRRHDEIQTQLRSPEYLAQEQARAAQAAEIQSKIEANNARLSGDLAPKDYLTFAKKQFADIFATVGDGISDTKTVGTLSQQISSAIMQMVDSTTGELTKNQQQAVTSWFKTKGGLNLDASTLAPLLTGKVDQQALEDNLTSQLSKGKGKQTRIGKELYDNFLTQQKAMAKYGTKKGSRETSVLEQDKQRQDEANVLKQQNIEYQNQINALQQENNSLKEELNDVQAQREQVSSNIQTIRAKQATAQTRQQTAKQKQTDLIAQDAEYKKLNEQALSNAEKYETLTQEKANLETFYETLTGVQQGFNELIQTLQKVNGYTNQEDVDALNEAKSQEVSRLTAERQQKGLQAFAQSEQNRKESSELITKYKEEFNADKTAQAEAEAFKQRMEYSIRQWMGAREIISQIKQGVREAYNDIKNLDAAMTNIAVVTDFSVEDLWGQINDYMAIAKQYGVTTQGVYEVTQLYYQQGLGTADVMAATTETLKMARIAGISYSDAADGMTVAIRAFNMDMEDAVHVTDVYSNVAA